MTTIMVQAAPPADTQLQMEEPMNTMTEVADRTVGELAVENPLSIRVFEAWKIDYCCGGQTSLTDACAAAGKSVDQFVSALEALTSLPDTAARDWSFDTLTTMAGDIVSMYHVFTREELQTLEPLAKKVLGVHGDRRRELADVMTLILAVRDDMLPHMLKEEQVLFPYVCQLEEAAEAHRPAVTPTADHLAEIGLTRPRNVSRSRRWPSRSSPVSVSMIIGVAARRGS